MATCYRCGAPNANYRRTTYTGFSTSSWTSKRSYGSGSRTYYGVRSVCQDCAKKIDRWNTIKAIFWIAIVVIVALYFFNGSSKSSRIIREKPYEYNGPTAKVIPGRGLNLRAEPSSNAAILLTIPKNDLVGVIDKNGGIESIAGQEAKWYKVDYRGTIGWLWSGFLEEQ